MNRRFLLTLAAFLVALSSVTACSGARTSAARVKVARSVGDVWADGCRLMAANTVGFVVAPGLVATVAHGVQGQTSITFDGVSASVIALDARTDTAMLRVNSNKEPLAFGAAREGETVRISLVGNQLDTSVKSIVTITHTNIPAHTSFQRLGFVLDRPVQFGNSGAPVINDGGQVVGMVYATAADDDQASYAVAASEIQTTLANALAGPASGPGICP